MCKARSLTSLSQESRVDELGEADGVEPSLCIDIYSECESYIEICVYTVAE